MSFDTHKQLSFAALRVKIYHIRILYDLTAVVKASTLTAIK